MKVFLLLGQSNMQGFGKIANYPVLHDKRIFNLAGGKAEVAVEPLHHWDEHPMPDGIGLGLAMPFALDVLKVYPDIRIGFIPAARGGSSLDQWMPGNDNFERAIALYKRAVKNNPDIELAGVLWHQGEADSAEKSNAQTYGERFLKTINGFRKRLSSPGAPVIVGELGRFLSLSSHYVEYATVVKQTKEAIVLLGNAAFVSSEGLTCGEEYSPHFNTESIREFGLRYAKAYLNIIKINK